MIQYNKLNYLIHSGRPYILQKFYWRSNKWIKFKIRCFGIVLSQFPILRLSEIVILWISGQIEYYDRLSHAPSYKISTFCIRSGSRLHCNASFPFCCYIFSPDDLWYPSLLYIIPLVRVYFVWSWLLTSIQQDQQVIMMRKCSMSVGSKTLWTLLRLGGCHLLCTAKHSKYLHTHQEFCQYICKAVLWLSYCIADVPSTPAWQGTSLLRSLITITITITFLRLTEVVRQGPYFSSVT